MYYYLFQKLKHLQCDICLSYVKKSLINVHRDDHYKKFQCQFCDFTVYSMNEIIKHMKSGHAIQNIDVPLERRKVCIDHRISIPAYAVRTTTMTVRRSKK
jgi:hypothetical protein